MSEFKGTPGKWRIDGPTSGFNPNMGMWTVENHVGANIANHVTLHDARLISAAPELFYAIRLCVQRIERPELSPDANVVLEQARAAIAKALGEGQ